MLIFFFPCQLGQIVEGSQWFLFMETVDPGKRFDILHVNNVRSLPYLSSILCFKEEK